MPRVTIESLPRMCAGRSVEEQTWKRRSFWLAVQSVLAFTLDQMPGEWREGLEGQAKAIKAEYEAIFPLLDRACAATCPWCPTPCCLVADARFDLKDLLFIHLTRGPLPLGQPRGDGHAVCRYLGPSGCLLRRLSRPWICTWYLCPMQKQWFSLSIVEKEEFKELNKRVEGMKRQRKELEKQYLRALLPIGK